MPHGSAQSPSTAQQDIIGTYAAVVSGSLLLLMRGTAAAMWPNSSCGCAAEPAYLCKGVLYVSKLIPSHVHILHPAAMLP